MKRYNIDCASEKILNDGYEMEGYEKILSFDIWLVLNKVSLTKPKIITETLDVSTAGSIKELKDFVEKCEKQGFETFEADYFYEDDVGYLKYFNIVCKRQIFEKKSTTELQSEYYDYANRIIKKNQRAYQEYKTNLEKEKTEFAQYLKLKEKYEGLK